MKRATIGWLALLLLVACRRPVAPAPTSPPAPHVSVPAAHLVVPRLDAVVVDGEPDEPGWQTALLSGAFLDPQGAPARPHSELRVGHDGRDLLLLLYAADEDIQTRPRAHDAPLWTDDAFALQLQPDGTGPVFAVDVSAAATVTDARLRVGQPPDVAWESLARTGVEKDGTYNDTRDDDEEWLVELAIPLARLGLKPGQLVALRASRCDVPKGGKRSCGQWQAQVQLAP